MGFYGEVLKELVVALGAALFIANVLALVRRRRDREQLAQKTVARARPGSPVRGYNRPNTGDLVAAPVVRSATYAILGFFVMMWGIASVVR